MKKYAMEHPEAILKIKKFHFNQYSNNYTSIELKIKNILDMYDISYQHNKQIYRYFPDFLILNKIIETDGIYWHNPEKDKIRDAKLLELGYDILRLSEYEINHEIEITTEKIKIFLDILQK